MSEDVLSPYVFIGTIWFACCALMSLIHRYENEWCTNATARNYAVAALVAPVWPIVVVAVVVYFVLVETVCVAIGVSTPMERWKR